VAIRRRDLSLALAAPAIGVGLGAMRSAVGIRTPESSLARLPELLEVSRTPGIAVGLVSGGRLAWRHDAGVLENGRSAGVDDWTLWVAASLSKQAVAYAALRLADAGRLDLDKPVASLPAVREGLGDAGAGVTPKHLLSHSSGLPNWRSGPDLTTDFEAGTRFQYSGEGYYLLAQTLEAVTGVGFEALMQRDVFAPLGMTSSTFLWRDDAGARLVAGHRSGNPWSNKDHAEQTYALLRDSGEPLAAWTQARIARARGADGRPLVPGDVLYPNPAFSLLTTLEDYGRLVSRLLARRGDAHDLSENSLRALHTPRIRVNSRLAWTQGLGAEEIEGETWFWQWGNNAGAWTNLLLMHPASDTALIVFSNGANGMRVAEPLAKAATGVDHPLFLWI
jgi:CubicO group peptidase (beta-lactamase class C family)